MSRCIDLRAADVANSFIAIQCDVNKSSFDSSSPVFRTSVYPTPASLTGLLLVGTWRVAGMMDRLADSTQQGRGTPMLQLTICPLNNSITPDNLRGRQCGNSLTDESTKFKEKRSRATR